MPGTLVGTSPVALRIPSGAVIFGSNVSNWLGPPWRNKKITDLPVRRPGRPSPCACNAARSASVSPPAPIAAAPPIRRNARRECELSRATRVSMASARSRFESVHNARTKIRHLHDAARSALLSIRRSFTLRDAPGPGPHRGAL